LFSSAIGANTGTALAFYVNSIGAVRALLASTTHGGIVGHTSFPIGTGL
jgi:hypothetical protein